MKRLRVILLFLLLGAIVNVAVAWGCTLHSRISESAFDTGLLVSLYRQAGDHWVSPSNDAERRAHAAAFRLWPQLTTNDVPASVYQDFSLQYFEGFGVVILSGFADVNDTPSADDERRIWSQTYSAGWPMRSQIVRVDRAGLLHGGFLVPVEWMSSDRENLFIHWQQPQVQPAIPVNLIWSGFAINMIFYAAILWLLIPGPFALRRLIRHRRGLCVKCAYDLRGAEHEACPECGEEVAHPSPN